MLQTHQNRMSTNLRPNNGDEFHDIPSKINQGDSLIGQVATGVKSSIHSVWNYLKSIDAKLRVPNIQEQLRKINSEQSASILNQQKTINSPQLNSDTSQCVSLEKSSHPITRALTQTPTQDQPKSKKQRLHEKKLFKKVISFDNYLQQEQQKLNQSYIRKNISQKKSLNHSMAHNHSMTHNQNNTSLLLESKLSLSHQNLPKPSSNLLQKPSISQINHNTSAVNPHNDTILNISDIDSECNFNILNNDADGLSGRKPMSAGEDYDDDEREDQKDQKALNKQPTLQLSEYPLMTRNRKTALPKSIVNHKHQIPLKRNLSPLAFEPQSNTRKKVKQSHCYDQDYDESYDEEAAAERNTQFDKLLQKRYDLLTEDMLKNWSKNEPNHKDQPLSLKEDFAKYIAKNFGAMQHVKSRLQSNSRQVQKKQQQGQGSGGQVKKQKLSQILRPSLSLSAQIKRKKLYTFTRQCESKINICFQLEKSVREDRQRQAAEERRKKEEEERRRREEEERVRREIEMKRRLDEEERKRIERQQQALRVADEIKQKKTQQLQLQQQQQNEQHANQLQTQDLKSSQHQSDLQPQEQDKTDDKLAQQLQDSTNQPQKPIHLLAAASLFKNPQNPSQQDSESKQTQKNIKKTSSTTESKPTDPQLKPSTTKSPQIPNTSPNSPKDQQQKKQVKYNPFMAALGPPKPSHKLQDIINNQKDDKSLFKTVIPTIPPTATITSPQRQPPQPSPSVYMSPALNKHNTSHYSNLDSSMCEESQSNINPTTALNQASNLNGSFLNNSFSSQQQQNSSLFANPNTANSLFGPNPSSMQGPAYNLSGSVGLFSTQPSKPTISGSLFGNTQMNMFVSNSTSSLATEAVNKVPSFMQGHPTIAPNINPQNAMSLFNQRSPNKNQAQSLFGAPKVQSVDKRNLSRRDKKNKEERIR